MKISPLIVGPLFANFLLAAKAPAADLPISAGLESSTMGGTLEVSSSPVFSAPNKNLLASLKDAFISPHWDQRRLLNGTAYGVLLALSIDATNAFGYPIVLDPDSTTHAPATVQDFVRGLNQKNYFEHWADPYYPISKGRQWRPFTQISVNEIPNGEKTKDAIKEAIDRGQAVVFTYNFTKDDCKGAEEFFRLKFNLGEDERYIDDSSYDALYEGAHTVCIVGYDDADNSFLVQDSRGTARPFALPGLAYLENKPSGKIKISQGLDYGLYIPKPNKMTGIYRHEFFVLAADWVQGDFRPPEIKDVKMGIASNLGYPSPKGQYYEISAYITDNVKVANDVSLSISMPGAGAVRLCSTFRDGIMLGTMPILDPEHMSAPIEAAISVTAFDTSANEAAHEMTCHFPLGLPLALFEKEIGAGPGGSIQPSHQNYAATAKTFATSYQGPRSPFSAHSEYSLIPPPKPDPDIPQHINLVAHLNEVFAPMLWDQGNLGNCVAYGSLMALSIGASSSNAWGNQVVFDPDSTLQVATKVPNYIAMLNNRGYLNKWNYPDYQNRYALSHISIHQIGNNGGAKNAIKEAIDNNQAVVFVFRHWKGSGPGSWNLFNEFWKTRSEHEIFTGITGIGNECDWKMGGHAMCIVGYDDYDNTFIVQNSWSTTSNRPHGTLKIPQDLNYDKWHYDYPIWPLTAIGGEYRFEFYRLAPSWVTDDTEPPVIHSIGLVPVFVDSSSQPHHFALCVHVTDNVKVTDVKGTLVLPSGDAPTLTGTINSIYSPNIWRLIDLPMMSDPLSLVRGILTVEAYDSSGNKSVQNF